MTGPSPKTGHAVVVPACVSTACPELDLVWSHYARVVLDRPGILIADSEDDLNWHAFLGHSIDMQGFHAAEFVRVDRLTRSAPQFVPLRHRGKSRFPRSRWLCTLLDLTACPIV